jgi:hypothetical protein
MGLQKFEQRLERLVEGVFAKAFRSGVQPVELGRRMVREMDLHRAVGVRGVLAPNDFAIWVSVDDHQHLSSIEQTLLGELADTVREHAKAEGYRLPGPIKVELLSHPDLSRGTFRVVAELVEGGPVGAVILPDGTRVPVGTDPVTIGRTSDCQVVLSDPTVSKHHAEIRRPGADVIIVDLGSTNGTKVNNTGIRERQLVDGDEIRIGATVLRYETT